MSAVSSATYLTTTYPTSTPRAPSIKERISNIWNKGKSAKVVIGLVLGGLCIGLGLGLGLHNIIPITPSMLLSGAGGAIAITSIAFLCLHRKTFEFEMGAAFKRRVQWDLRLEDTHQWASEILPAHNTLGSLTISGMPTTLDDLSPYTLIVNCCEDKETNGTDFFGNSFISANQHQEAGRRVLKIQTVDHQPVSIKELQRAANQIHIARQKGQNILVHCKAGQGRSAQVIAAYLIRHTTLNTPDKAIKFIQEHRANSLKRKGQQENIKKFAEEGYNN
jgi:hypothetical protein